MKLTNGLRKMGQPMVFADAAEKSPFVIEIDFSMYPIASSSGNNEKLTKYNFMPNEIIDMITRKITTWSFFKNSPIPKNKFFYYSPT